ncbi:MAG: hypothetical protein M1835_004761 [Candelina submexicana]|nr:MAG: hypothetical protein M1835_004761 [Candelina submexicana]
MAEYLNPRAYQPPEGGDAHTQGTDHPKNAFAEEARRKAEQLKADQRNISSTDGNESALRPTPKDQATVHISKQRPYIEPATPFLPGYPTGSTNSFFKNRAVTEPIRQSATVAPLFSSGKTKNLQPKKSRSSKDNKQLPALPPSTSAKAAAVLGETIPPATGTKAPPTTSSASAPATTVKFNRGSDNTDTYIAGDTRQVKSQPGPPTVHFNESKQGQPTARFFHENDMSHVFTVPSPPNFDSPSPPPPPPKPDAMFLGDGRMNPTKGGTYGRLGNVNVMPPPPRMESMTGAIEHRGDIEGPPPNQQYQPSGLGIEYSPSIYGNGFEDPPPTAALHPYSTNNAFHDQQRQTSSDSHSLNISQNSQASKMTLPFVFAGHRSELTPTDSNPHQSAPSTAIPPYPTPIPLPSGNCVPPHPSWIPSPRTVEADKFAHQMLALHYQINHETGTIGRKIDTRCDGIVDQIIGRWESSRDVQAEYQNDLRMGLNAVEHNLARVVGEVHYLNTRFEEESGKGPQRLGAAAGGGGGNSSKRRIENVGGDKGGGEGVEATLEKLVRMGEVVMGKLEVLTERIAVVERKVENGSCQCATRISSSSSSAAAALSTAAGSYQHTPNPASHHQQQQHNHNHNPAAVNMNTGGLLPVKHSSPQKYHHQTQTHSQQHAPPQHPPPPPPPPPSQQYQTTPQSSILANSHHRHRSPERKPHTTTTNPRDTPDLRNHPAFAGFAFAEPARQPVRMGNDLGREQGDLGGAQGHWYQQVYEGWV